MSSEPADPPPPPDAMRAQLAGAYAVVAKLQLNLHARDF
jgi:hypothetical protein